MWEGYSIDEATVVQATSWSSMSTSPIAGGSALCWWIDEVADLGQILATLGLELIAVT
jgi:hypothetical protein